MPSSANNFDKCPPYDQELKDWSIMCPDLKEAFFGDKREYAKCVYALANLKSVDVADNKLIEYGFSEEQIKTIAESYKDDSWNGLISNITEDVKKYRASSDKENSYINNIIRDWKEYEVPAVEHGYYQIRGPGIFRVVETYNEETGSNQYVTKDVCRTPFVLCGVSEPLHDDNIYYKIRHGTISGEVKEFWASQSTLLSRTDLKTKFLAKGINCPENDILKEALDYISRSIAEFAPRLKKEFSAIRNGWSEDKSIFVLGNRTITVRGIEPILSVGAGKGFSELDKKGTLDGWIAGVKPFLEYDLIRFKCYDALTAVLNTILGVESHITDHYGNTSCGKTLSAWVALSMVGDAEGLTIGAKSTAKGILLTVRDFSDLPILIDESSDAGDHLKDLVYPLTSNKGRVKSTQDGERDGGEEYHTTTLMTGEKPIRDCLTNSGQQYRVNELNDSLPDLPTKEILRLKQAIRNNNGHIIEIFIKKVFEWRESGALQITYDNCFDVLPDNVSNIEGRSRSIFAGIMTAGVILERVFKEIGIQHKNPEPIVNKYFQNCILENPVELEYIRALRVTLDWVHSDYGRFTEEDIDYDTMNVRDKTKRYGYVDRDYIDIIGTEFTKKMKEENFSPSKIKEDWWQQGIIDSNDPKRKGTYRFKRDKKLMVGIRIHRSIAEELIGVNHQEEANQDLPQDQKIMGIMKTIAFLTERKGKADINLIRQIENIPDLDDLLNILTQYGKILKLSQTEYKKV